MNIRMTDEEDRRESFLWSDLTIFDYSGRDVTAEMIDKGYKLALISDSTLSYKPVYDLKIDLKSDKFCVYLE